MRARTNCRQQKRNAVRVAITTSKAEQRETFQNGAGRDVRTQAGLGVRRLGLNLEPTAAWRGFDKLDGGDRQEPWTRIVVMFQAATAPPDSSRNACLLCHC